MIIINNMDLSIPGTNSPLSTATVFANNVQDFLGTGALQINPSGTIVVNSIDDAVNSSPGVTTLRDAINKANADSGEDLIVFDRSLFSTAQTITLNSGELDITHSLDIIAPRDTLTGGDLVTVSGNKASRVFEIETGAMVTLSGLIVADGSVTGANGGGILNSGTLTLDSSIVRNSNVRAVGISDVSLGGGIYSTGATTVNNSTISNNGASWGGGIYNTGATTVNNSTISSNRSSVGGGIYNTGATTVNNSTISGNSAPYGGGISSGGTGTTTVNDSTISGNLASSGGGGIYNLEMSIITVNNSTISGNSAQFEGGGIYGTATVNNSTISNNSASAGQGGGIYGTATVNDSTISGNSAQFEGGGIYGTATVNNSTISGNSASMDSGGGIYGSSTVNNSNISGNSAGFEGGGIYGTTTVNNSTISGNSITKNNRGGYGGGIYSTGISTVTNTTISGNLVSGDFDSYGGGIENTGTLTVSNSTISGNSADTKGGQYTIPYFGIVTVEKSGSGGGIVNYGTLTISNSTISGNSADTKGGGIDNAYTGTLTLLFSTVTQNIAANGGGVYQEDVPSTPISVSSSFNVRNSIIAANLNTLDGVNPDVSGTFTSNGYNLIGDSTGSTGFCATGDIVGTSGWVIDPRLAPLDFYGGPTQTVALLPDSPAIGAADPIVLATDSITDQRGLPRRAADGSADIGAYEFS